ncbi:hypothetical protein SAMN06265795_104128 [Noviherbaspirillum humi]|uniref:Uncharacterized protein n=2 Tax=Noviherbaspirillum humi TaxID=1688639 RepID=A0A239FVL8_9BURK|nr:hypothetical protein SAMN06265795_104128 [Noviherbaspirillum humi]
MHTPAEFLKPAIPFNAFVCLHADSLADCLKEVSRIGADFSFPAKTLKASAADVRTALWLLAKMAVSCALSMSRACRESSSLAPTPAASLQLANIVALGNNLIAGAKEKKLLPCGFTKFEDFAGIPGMHRPMAMLAEVPLAA